jgi:hypothetical protein
VKITYDEVASRGNDKPSGFRLDPGPENTQLNGFLRFDEQRHCLFFTTNLRAGTILHCQDITTGLTLVHQRLMLTDIFDNAPDCEVTISTDGRYVGISATCSGYHTIVGMWEVENKLDFGNRHRIETWASQMGIWKFSKHPFTHYGSQRFKPTLAFTDDGWLVTRNSSINLLSELVEDDQRQALH